MSEPYRVNPWHLAGHLWVMEQAAAKVALQATVRNLTAYANAVKAYTEFRHGEP